MKDSKFVDSLIATFNFLFWLQKEDPNEMWGGVKISEAIEGAKVLSGMSDEQLEQIRKICLGEHDEPSEHPPSELP